MPSAPKTNVDAKQYERDRGSPSKRGYGRRWQHLRHWFLKRHPICEWPGCTLPATDVDHIKPKRRGGLDASENLQALCHAHHSVKTAEECK